MKRISAFLISLLLIFQLGATANVSAAEASFSVISAYYKDGRVYSFLDFKNNPNLERGRFNIIEDKIIGDYDSIPQKVVDTDSLASYMFLIDTSTSMPIYKDQITALADSLLKNEKNRINVSIATFGEKFTLVRSGLSNIERITSIVNGLDYNENATDICGGLIDAFDFVSSHEMEEGEICEIILITDGIPYLSDGGNDQTALANASSTLKKKIQNTPEVIVHSVCFGDWDDYTYTYDAVSRGTGLHENVTSELSCEQAGARIAQFTDSLYEISLGHVINPFAERVDVDIISLDSSETVTVKNIRNFDQANFTFLTIDPNLIDGSETNQEETTEETTAEPTTVVETTAVQETTPPATEEAATVDEPVQSDKINILPILISALVLLLLIAAVIVVIIFVKKKGSDKKPPNSPETSNKPRFTKDWVNVSAQVVQGNCLTDNLNLRLRNELIIGSDQSCDLVFDDEYIAPRNSRIFINEGVVYIEDLNERSNTYLEGMKLYTPNRLRSGDEISIGNTTFKLLF